MNVLALDTCFDACSVAAGRALRSLSPSIVSYFEPMASGHAERVVGMIEAALNEAGLKTGDLTCIALTNGPGTFTGARIGVAAARALALAHATPVVAVSSLSLMARNPVIPAAPGRELVIATDARREEVYFQRFDPHTLAAAGEPGVLPIVQAAQVLSAKPVQIAGSAAVTLAGAVNALGGSAIAEAPGLLPDAIDMLFVAPSWPPVARVSPLYLRAPDAKPSQSPFAGAFA